MRRALVVALLLGACVLAGTARADGDPASDYLYTLKVFLPFDVKVPKARQRELVSLVEATNRSGYAIRVAVIGSSYDLGSVTSLWRQPRTYARFLGAELQFIYAKRLLIVMPNGFGYFYSGHDEPVNVADIRNRADHCLCGINLARIFANYKMGQLADRCLGRGLPAA